MTLAKSVGIAPFWEVPLFRPRSASLHDSPSLSAPSARLKSPRPAKAPPKVVVGRAEFVRLPRWNTGAIRAKVDTGAQTSALHVTDLEPIGERRVRFGIVLHPDESLVPQWVETDIVRRAWVRSSNGKAEKRWFVRTVLELGDVEREIEISLTCRRGMRFRMLLGCEALAPRFLVDPSRRYLATGKRAQRAR